jgi:hypothetical protein
MFCVPDAAPCQQSHQDTWPREIYRRRSLLCARHTFQTIKYAAMRIQRISGNSIIIPQPLAGGLMARGYYEHVSVGLNEEMV